MLKKRAPTLQYVKQELFLQDIAKGIRKMGLLHLDNSSPLTHQDIFAHHPKLSYLELR